MSDRIEDLPLFSTPAGASPAIQDSAVQLRPDTSLSAGIGAWGEQLEQDGKSIHTVKAFTGDLRLCSKYIGSGTALNSIGTHDLKNFLNWMMTGRGVPCSPKTYARRVTSIKAFFRWLNEIGVLQEDPAAAIPQNTVLSPLPEVLSPEEVTLVLKVANDYRSREKPDARPFTLVALLLDSGIKKSECLNITLNHIDLHASEGPLLWIRYSDVQKRYRERKIPLTQEWIVAYHEYLRGYGPKELLFPYSPRRLEYLLEEVGEAASLEKHLSFNMCRWTCALSDYESGMERDKIRQKLGLSKIQWREIGNKLDRLAAQRDTEAQPA